jgi:hypothetical protein
MWGWWTRMFYRSHIDIIPPVAHDDELEAAREARRRAESKRKEFDAIASSLADQRRANQFAARMSATFRSRRP